MFLNDRLDEKDSFHFFKSKRPFAQQDFILIPSNLNGNHWIVVIIDMLIKTVYIFDSLCNNHRSIVRQITKYLILENYVTIGTKLDTDTDRWSIIINAVR